MKLLHIDSGILGDNSVSRRLSAATVAELKARHPGLNVAYRDLAASDPHLLFLEIRQGGEPILVRIVHTARAVWTDFFTASDERARSTGAATLAVWRSLERARQEAASRFEFGGVDPAGNRGVFDFKRALSRHVIQSGPTWIYARNAFIRRAAATALFLRAI